MKTFIFSIICLASLQANAQEALQGFSADSEGVTFQVHSSGCTKKSDFSFIVLDSVPAKVLLTRNNEDLCEAYVPYGTPIKFSYDELGFNEGDEFNILNPLATVRVIKTKKVNL